MKQSFYIKIKLKPIIFASHIKAKSSFGGIKSAFSFVSIGILISLFPSTIIAQNDTIKYDIKLYGLVSTGKYSPFWLQSNQYDKFSSAPSSGDLQIGFSKDYGVKKKLFDYGFKANLLLRTDKATTTAYFHEMYAKARLSVFDLAIGAREEQYGNQDSTLSCGGLLFSKNARPMPKISIGIEKFITVPFTFNLLEIKGGLTHGWFTDNIYTKDLLLHHKFIYARIGGKLPVHIQAGLDHVAQWGGTVPDPKYGQLPHGFKDYISIFFVQSGGTGGEAINALGNHIISQSLKLEADISDFKLAAYWQNISEDGPIRLIGKTMNASDGLWGMSIKNKQFPFIKGLLYEYLNTTDQSGPYHDKDGIVYGGADSYFSNYIYNNGWSYYSRIIGTPLITSAIYNSNGEVYTLNNRVQAHHFGIEGDVYGYNYKVLATFSKNYGTYSNSMDVHNTSTLVEVNKQFPHLHNVEIGCSVGADRGKLFGNSAGVLFSVRKMGNLFSY